MTTYKTSEPLSGVKCSVQSCEFNVNGQSCTASSICVKPLSKTTDTHETDCATFSKRSNTECQ